MIQKLINNFRVIFQNYRSFARVFNAFLSTYFSDILDLQRSSTTRINEEEAGVMEDVEVIVEDGVEDGVEDDDSEDEVLVLEDTTGGQDSKGAEVIIYVTVIRDPFKQGCGSGSAWIRIIF